MKYPVCMLAAALAVLSLPAVAKTAQTDCYTPAQLQAEQLLRLHSELMVVTVTCRTGSNGEDLGAVYGDFTKKNIRVLSDAEQTMKDYYRAHARGKPVDHLDRLRTTLANEFGQKSADMSSTAFCASYRDNVAKFAALSGADVQNEVQRMAISEKSYIPACPAGTTAASK